MEKKLEACIEAAYKTKDKAEMAKARQKVRQFMESVVERKFSTIPCLIANTYNGVSNDKKEKRKYIKKIQYSLLEEFCQDHNVLVFDCSDKSKTYNIQAKDAIVIDELTYFVTKIIDMTIEVISMMDVFKARPEITHFDINKQTFKNSLRYICREVKTPVKSNDVRKYYFIYLFNQ